MSTQHGKGPVVHTVLVWVFSAMLLMGIAGPASASRVGDEADGRQRAKETVPQEGMETGKKRVDVLLVDWVVARPATDVMEPSRARNPQVNCRDEKGWTPLHWAVFYGHKDLAEMLLSRGAEVNSKDAEGKTPLYWAISKGDRRIAELLRYYGADE